MTLLSRRKRRTTVRSITPGTRAAKAALLLALFAAPALAQPPGSQPRTQPAGTAPTGQPAAASPTLPNGLALPPGYRPRTPPPPPAAPALGGAPGAGGTVMYFQKPADALTATGGGLSATDGVAQVSDRAPVVPLPVPDAAPVRPLPVPAERPTARPVPPLEVPTAFAAPQPVSPQPVARAQPRPGQPGTSKEPYQIKDVDPREIQLPPRDKILGVVYNDAELERAIVDSALQDRIRTLTKQLKEETEKKNDTQALEKTIRELRAIKDPLQSPEYQFPMLPVVSPAGIAYQAKTAGYAPRQLLIEPGYVVHRRLHFEQPNAERGGWDLGPLSTLVSAGQFYRGVLLWPQSLASGCVFGFWDTSAGKCLPGSPTPYYLYPPNLTVTGTVAEAGLLTGFSFLFP